jgi:cytochrome c-type biogenesis protein CcmH
MTLFRPLIFILFLMSVLGGGLASAVVVDKPLDDPKLEIKARDIMSGIRCLVCQNQSIEESDAGLAQDLRLIIRERVLLGESKAEIHEFLVSRYGDWVLMRPPFKSQTVLLWFGPFLILLMGGLGLYISSRKKQIKIKPLSKEEEVKLKAILKKGLG